jgi:hypothetical protein
LKDGQKGTWSVEKRGEKFVVVMKWTTTNGYADFEIVSATQLKCIKSGWSFMNSWKLQIKDQTAKPEPQPQKPPVQEKNVEELTGSKDSGYRGYQTKTRGGLKCQMWSS